MVIPVNPPPLLKIPKRFFDDPELRPFFEQQKTILFQLWNRSGGSIDIITETIEALTSTASRVARDAAKINALEKVGFDVELVTADFTTLRNQILICKNTSPISVTLDPNAVNEDMVHIKRRASSITVVGTIDGLTNKIINVVNYSMFLAFDGTDWSEI